MAVRKAISVTLDVDVIRQLDDAARDAGTSRTALIEAMVEQANWSDVVDSLRYPRTEGS